MNPTITIEKHLLQRILTSSRILHSGFALLIFLVFLSSASIASAVEMPELAKKNECVNCHSINERVVGPAWMVISNKYKDDPAAAEKLMTRISKGSSGFFGLIHMPANDPDGHKQGEIRELVKFILTLSKADANSTAPGKQSAQ